MNLFERLQEVPALAYAFSAALGLIIGSFLNVVVARLPEDKSVVRPGSRCPKCGKSIAWYDNVPVLSWLLLRGKCRSCAAPISPRYPLVELLTALVFVAVFHRQGWGVHLLVRGWPLVAILIAVTFIDLDHRIIPDELSLGGLALGLATCWLDPDRTWLECVGGAALGYGLFFGIAWIYLQTTGRSGLGGGDIKLLAMLGAFMGPVGVFTTIMVSSLGGSLVGIAWGLYLRSRGRRKRRMMKLAIPYGPFLVIGALYYYLFDGGLWLRFMTPT